MTGIAFASLLAGFVVGLILEWPKILRLAGYHSPMLDEEAQQDTP